MAAQRAKEAWASQLGVILAVAGSAVGLGNFLRFPGLAAQYGGGAFMVAYFVSFLLIGLPICWAEWTMGRYGGQRGFNSSPGIFFAVSKHPSFRFLGVIGVIIPVVIYMYYVYIEAWCLGYALNFITGNMHFDSAAESGAYFEKFVGIEKDGTAVGFAFDQVGAYLIFAFILNFFLIYRGLNKGIEWFCKYAMPTLIVLAVIILIRVLTLGAPVEGQPEWSVNNGLGYMWNPNKVMLEERVEDSWKAVRMVPTTQREAAEAQVAADPNLRLQPYTIWQQLLRPQLWLAAAGQIFFSLSVGFGVIITYSSYMSRRDDVVLSGLSAASANEFAEVALGGLITVTAGVAFMGVAAVAGQSTFGLGFNVLPLVFSQMPAGWFFGFLFFFLLFLAAVTSSLSMLQPGIAFLEEALNISRRASVTILGTLTAIGAGFVMYFSAGVKALDSLDFWVGNVLIYVLATIQVILFAWVMGVDKGFKEAARGASFPIPGIFKFILKYVSPILLLSIFIGWLLLEVFGVIGDKEISTYITDLVGGIDKEPNLVARMSLGLILLIGICFSLIAATSSAYDKRALADADRREDSKRDSDV